MLLEQEFNTLAARYSFDDNEYDIGAFIWAKAEHAMLDNCMLCTLEETTDTEDDADECSGCACHCPVEGYYEDYDEDGFVHGSDEGNKRTVFSTEEIQKYYTGFGCLPKDKTHAKITASEAQFLSSLLKQALKSIEKLKRHDKVKADVIWAMCDKNNEATAEYYEELKLHLNRKDKTKKQANKLAAIQKKLKVIASS